MSRTRIFPLALLVAAWAFLFLVPPPNFPVYDGIVFCEEARHLAQGGLWLFPTSEVSGLLHAAYGALVGLAFGLTHANLNATVMVIAGAAVVIAYFWLLKWCDGSEALLGSLLLLTSRREGLVHWLFLLILPACVATIWFFEFRPPRTLPLFPWVIVPP